MPLTFPLPLSEFQERFTIASMRFALPATSQVDRTAGGGVLKASLGDELWRGSFSIPPTNDRSEAARLDGLISVLDRSGSFFAFDASKPYPAADPDGWILEGATPSILSLDSGDARMVALQGLPAGYDLTGGDLIGWAFGSDPVRYALHRIISDVTADGTGETQQFEVVPFIDPGAAPGMAVSLIKPVIKAVMEPDPGYAQHRPVVASGQQFSFVQTKR